MLRPSGLYPGEEQVCAVFLRRARRFENHTCKKCWEGDQWNIQTAHLYPRLAELGPLAEFLPGVDVRVLRPLEGLLQLVQLVSRERRSRPPLLTLQCDFHSRQENRWRWKVRIKKRVLELRVHLEGDARLRLHIWPVFRTSTLGFNCNGKMWEMTSGNVRRVLENVTATHFDQLKQVGRLEVVEKGESSSNYFLPGNYYNYSPATHFET